MIYQKEPTDRQKKLYRLRNKCQYDEAAMHLYRKVQEQCTMLLERTNSAPESMVIRYNQLVRASDLPFSERQKLLMEEKK